MTAHPGNPKDARNINCSTIMMSGFPVNSLWLMVLLATFHIPNGVHTAALVKRWTKCQTSFETVRVVSSCPTTDKTYTVRAQAKKCESYRSCDGEPCVYHCAMNPWGNETVEVCAPETLITGYFCPHFSTGVGRILEHYSYPCRDCPFNYPSTTSFQYKSCSSYINTSEDTTQKSSTEKQTTETINSAIEKEKNPCPYKEGAHSKRLKRRICKNSATTALSPTQKLPEERIFYSSEEGAILSNSTQDPDATDSDRRSGYETAAIICGIILGILASIIPIVIVLYRKGYMTCGKSSSKKSNKNKQKDYDSQERQDFLTEVEKQAHPAGS